MTTEQQQIRTAETPGERYARQTRNATVTLAVLAVVGVIASLIIGIIAVVAVNHGNSIIQQQTGSATSTNCDMSNPNWPNC